MKKILIFCFFATGLPVEAQPFVFVFLNKKEHLEEVPKDQLDKLMEGHMANIQRLVKEKKLVAAGPFEGGGGIFIFHADSKKQVEEWVSTDPAVLAKRWDIEMFSYHPSIGSVCAVAEPIEMTQYNFMRYEVQLGHSQSTAEVMEHERYIRDLGAKVDIIGGGTFDAQEGGILVTRGEVHKELIEMDPLLQQAFMRVVFKSLFIAKGAFCEK